MARAAASEAAGKAAHRLRKSRKISIAMQDLIQSSRRRLLGVGGFCTVEQAAYQETDCAVKRLKPATMADQRKYVMGAQDLAAEATMLTSLQHENIVQVKGMSPGTVQESVERSEGFYLVMEKLELTLDKQITEWAKTIKPTIRTRRALLKERMNVALPLAKALAYLHSQDICHRDVKPGNIGFDEDGVLKVFDLGIAVHIPNGQYKKAAAGTTRYMAPEMLRRQPYNVQADVYSFAMVLYEICALCKPFSGESNKRFFVDIVATNGQRPRVPMWWPGNVKSLLAACWDGDFRKRPTMKAVVAKLEKIL